METDEKIQAVIAAGRLFETMGPDAVVMAKLQSFLAVNDELREVWDFVEDKLAAIIDDHRMWGFCE